MSQIPLYCVECGNPLVEGACTDHPSTKQAIEEQSSGAGRSVRSFLVLHFRDLLLVLVAVLVLTTIIVTLRGDRQLGDQLTAVEQANRGLRQRLADQRRAATQLGGRVASLEAELAKQPDLAAIAKTTKESVFLIEATDSRGFRPSGGTGFVVESGTGSTLITNYHVIEVADEPGGHVSVRRGQETYPARITQTDPEGDLAVLTINEPFPALELSGQRPSVGDSIVVVGSPLGLEGSVSTGIVSAFRGGFMQLSAAVSPGSSGAPVVDAAGDVVGVVERKVVGEGAEGLGFAIPTSEVCATVLSC